MTEFPNLSLIIGGVASGKSGWAEGLVRSFARPKTYIATAQAFDDEMAAKIARHRRDRGPDWRTLEVPLELAAALGAVPEGHVVLVDCLTLWLSNQLLAEADIAAKIAQLSAALGEMLAPVVLVSGEVGAAPVPENDLARAFQNELGQLNQRIAAHADLVVNVVVGLPLLLKGALPRGAT